jgi:TRAP-type C4-dicarboxylate transport system substrate-binding protein
MILKRTLTFVLFSVFLVVFLAACSSSSTSQNENRKAGQSEGKKEDSSKETITLKVADSFPTNNDLSVEGAVYWMDRVEELTNGQVQFEYFPAEQLGKAASMLDLVKNKIADIAYTAPAYISDKLPLGDVAGLPGLISSSSQGGAAYWELAQTALLDEEFLKNGVRPVWVTTLPPGQVFTTNKKVESAADFKGVKLRASGGTQEMTIATLGGVPVSIPAPDIFTAMERGTVEGGVVPFTSWKAYQLEKLAKYATNNSNLGSFAVVYTINEEVYQGLPDNVKDAMKQAGDETVDHVSKHLDNQIKQLEEEFQKIGLEIYSVDEADLKEWGKKVKPVQDEWVKKMEAKGLAGQKVLDALIDALSQ